MWVDQMEQKEEIQRAYNQPLVMKNELPATEWIKCNLDRTGGSGEA
jgi:hypothetical protein